MDLPIELFKLLGLESKPDTSKWTKVATLKPEDITRSKTLQADVDKADGQIDVLKAKIHAIKSEGMAKRMEWWEHLHQTYSLPRGSNYTIDDDGSVRMAPNQKD